MIDKGIIGDPSTWPTVKPGGDLVKVQISQRVYVKMRREDAIAQGLLKEAEPTENKEQAPTANKRRGRPRKDSK